MKNYLLKTMIVLSIFCNLNIISEDKKDDLVKLFSYNKIQTNSELKNGELKEELYINKQLFKKTSNFIKNASNFVKNTVVDNKEIFENCMNSPEYMKNYNYFQNSNLNRAKDFLEFYFLLQKNSK